LGQHFPPLQQSDFEAANDAPTVMINRVAALNRAAVIFFIVISPVLFLVESRPG
jgi:hypothetical protein